MAFDLRDLKWAIAVFQYGSLRKAAESLNVQQSTLSRALTIVEHQLGVALFCRTNGGTRPTAAGLEFINVTKQTIERMDAAIIRLAAHAGGKNGRLCIGVQTSLLSGNLRATLRELHQQVPDVEIHLFDGASDHLISDLVSSIIDIAFIVEGRRIWSDQYLPVWSERLVLAIPEDHALVAGAEVSWSDMRHETFLLPMHGPGPEFYNILLRKVGPSDVCHVVRHSTALDRILSLIGAGWGLGLMLEGATGLTYPGVVFREIYNDQRPERVEFCACWQKANINPSLQLLLDNLRKRYPDLSGKAPATG